MRHTVAVLPTLGEILELPAVRRADPVLRVGQDALGRPVRWVHVSEVSDIAPLLDGGELILTTGIALPDTAEELARYAADLDAVGVAALAVELGRRYRTELPPELVDAARAVRLPLVELRREAPFVAVTQAVHTLILDARLQDGLERQTHRTALTALAFSTEPAAATAERARALGVPLDDRALTGVVVRAVVDFREPAGLPAFLRDLAGAAVSALRTAGAPALVGLLDDHRIAVLLAQDFGAQDLAAHEVSAPLDATLATLSDRLHALADRRRQAAVVIGAGSTVRGVEHAATTLREAAQVADTVAETLPPGCWRTFHRPPDLRLRGLVHALRDVPDLADYVDREIGPLLAHDAAHGTRLFDFVAAFCQCGGNKTATAAQLFVSRAALYDRIARVQRLLGVDLADPEVVLALHFAVLSRHTLQRPQLAVRSGA